MVERFTDRVRKVMALANRQAQRLNHEYIGTEHLLLALVEEGTGVGASALKQMGVDSSKVEREVGKLVKSGPDAVAPGSLPLTPEAKKVIGHALEESNAMGHNYVGTEHLLLGLLRAPEAVGSRVLVNLGLKLEQVRVEAINVLGVGQGSKATSSSAGELVEVTRAWAELNPAQRKVILTIVRGGRAQGEA